MKTTTGTNHFVDADAAIRYYLPYFEGDINAARKGVQRKLDSDAIFLGAPQRRPNTRVVLHRTEGRYFIEELGTFFERVKEQKIPFERSGADLCVPETPEVQRLLKDYPELVVTASSYLRGTGGTWWLELPGAFPQEAVAS